MPTGCIHICICVRACYFRFRECNVHGACGLVCVCNREYSYPRACMCMTLATASYTNTSSCCVLSVVLSSLSMC